MSDPYAPLAAAPKEFTLAVALTPTIAPDGTYHCGKLAFENRREFNDFEAKQNAIGGTAIQLATLHHVETTGTNPHSAPMAPPPKGTTAHELLDITGKTPDAKGFYHLGTLQVHQSEYKAFAALQNDLTARNPEALAALYHMEHAPDRDVTFRVTKDSDRVDRYDPGTNTIYWNPHTMIRDAYDHHRVPADTAALHEETHWAGRDVGRTLQGIPAGHMENREEQRAIDGTEHRDMQKQSRDPRESHYGWVLPADRINSITPSLTAHQNGADREMHAPYQQTGRVMGVDPNGYTTIAIRGDGKHPTHQISFKTEQLSLALGGEPNGQQVLRDAQHFKDPVTFALTSDGRMTYSDPAQAQRQLGQTPNATFEYPTPMRAVSEPAAQSHPQTVEIGR